MDPVLLVGIFFGVLLAALLLGHPLGFTLGGLSVFFAYGLVNPSVFPMAIQRMHGIMTNFVLVAIPLFIFMGVMLEKSGIADQLYHGMHVWFGPLRGGLAIGTILLATILATTTGIIGASVVALGMIAYPAMVRRGYQKELALGTIASGGTLGILIPPSIMLVTYAAFAGLSAGKLFFAAFFPGFILSALYIVYITIVTAFKPEWGPPLPPEERAIPFKEKLRLLLLSIAPPVVLVLAVLGTIFLGVATPTEAAAMGALATVVLAAAKRTLSWDKVKETCYLTIRTTSMVGFLILGATALVLVFLRAGGGQALKEILLGLGLGPYGVLLAVMAIIFILGCFLDWIGILIINIAVLAPIVSQLQFAVSPELVPLWFALLVCVNLQTSFLTPPFGGALIYLKGVVPPGVTMTHIIKGSAPFIGLQLIGLGLIILFPQVVLWLPGQMVAR